MGQIVNADHVRLDSLVDLQVWLSRNDIPCASWGSGGTKTVKNLWDEVRSGETRLVENPCSRQVAVVKVEIEVAGRRLVEAEQLMVNGAKRKRNSPPTEKMKPGESASDAALRCVVEELGVEAGEFSVAAESVLVTTERQESPSYPGLPTEYLLYSVAAHVPGLPLVNFTTAEAPGSHDATVVTHFWEWR